MLMGSFDLQNVFIFQNLSGGNATSDNSSRYIRRTTVNLQHGVQRGRNGSTDELRNNSYAIADSVTGSGSLELKASMNNAPSCENMRFLVFVCSQNQLCGGWGDRQKGIISTYLLAMIMDRTFSIILDKPCDISQFLLPSEYNWRECHEYIQTVPQTKDGFSSIHHLLSSNESDVSVNRKMIFINTNVIWIKKLIDHPNATKRIPWAVNKTVPEVSKIVLAKLFRPSDALETEILKFTNKIKKNQKLICSHIRIGKNPTMPNDNNRHFGVPNVSAIFNFLKTYDDIGKYVIYIATDAENIRREAKTNFTNVLTSDLPIVHVDRVRSQQKDIECKGLFAVLLEQYILSRCDVLLLTRSNMGAMAAYLSKTPQTIFIFYHKNRTIFEVSLNEVQYYFKYE